MRVDHPVDGAPTIPIVFEAASPTSCGYHDDEAGVIYVNPALDADPAARAITIAHELGRADGREVAALWGPCAR